MDDSSIIPVLMMNNVNSFLSLWPSRKSFATAAGFNVEQVHKWAQNNRIPSKHLQKCLQAATDCGHQVTADDLIMINSRDRAAS